jgi:hypothetical protein
MARCPDTKRERPRQGRKKDKEYPLEKKQDI